MLSVTLIGQQSLIERLNAMPNTVRAALLRKVTQLTLQLERRVKLKLSGEVLKVQTGALRRSIFHTVESDNNQVIGKVASSADVPYAAIHEFGGTIQHPGGTAYVFDAKADAIRWVSNAKAQEWMRRTAPHAIHMPERSFMRSSLAEMAAEIRTQLRAAVVEGLHTS